MGGQVGLLLVFEGVLCYVNHLPWHLTSTPSAVRLAKLKSSFMSNKNTLKLIEASLMLQVIEN